jgi:creatinine amidohydrolase/Fe(II)-dependent formamide hydrolase-like protein
VRIGELSSWCYFILIYGLVDAVQGFRMQGFKKLTLIKHHQAFLVLVSRGS